MMNPKLRHPLWLTFILLIASTLARAQEPDSASVSKINIDASKLGSVETVNQFQNLARGVGWEFTPTLKTTTQLKRIGINRIRCINCDLLPGYFNDTGEFVMKEPEQLHRKLQTCRDLGANPHICLAINLHPDLKIATEDIPQSERELLGSPTQANEFGPTDWVKFRSHYKRLFKYVLIEKRFPQATFEVGGEPDIGTGVFVQHPPKPIAGSREAYDAYMEVYRNVVQAASEFEHDNPGQRVLLGGPSIGVYTFRDGTTNWAELFARDCADQKLRVDFVCMHVYGNVSPIRGDRGAAAYPPIESILQTVRLAIDQHLPGTPLWITEWGPSYTTNNTDASRVNADHVGAAWCAEFLNTMRTQKIDTALILVTTDSADPVAGGKFENVWGWPSFFVNPSCHWGRVYPKPIYHVVHMLTRLTGREIQFQSPQPAGIFASINPEARHLTLLAWNYDATIPEFDPTVDHSRQRVIDLVFQNLPADMLAGRLLIRRWQVSENEGNAATLFAKHETLTEKNTALPLVESQIVSPKNGILTHRITLPPSAVTFLEITPQ